MSWCDNVWSLWRYDTLSLDNVYSLTSRSPHPWAWPGLPPWSSAWPPRWNSPCAGAWTAWGCLLSWHCPPWCHSWEDRYHTCCSSHPFWTDDWCWSETDRGPMCTLLLTVHTRHIRHTPHCTQHNTMHPQQLLDRITQISSLIVACFLFSPFYSKKLI